MSEAPKVTPEDIEAQIAAVAYFNGCDAVEDAIDQDPHNVYFEPGVDQDEVLSNIALNTFCIIVLKNGYTFVGKSACVSKENFNANTGREIAYRNAFDKIFPAMGFLLKQSLYEKSQGQHDSAEEAK